ncbi:hypothetical protein EG329_004277 [Mollisiaceae sp. DMI_Dod_QoI]|nr:hypothetical protein EG329_004277 [Helotiales sp. DMI_Dod_QoI]
MESFFGNGVPPQSEPNAIQNAVAQEEAAVSGANDVVNAAVHSLDTSSEEQREGGQAIIAFIAQEAAFFRSQIGEANQTVEAARMTGNVQLFGDTRSRLEVLNSALQAIERIWHGVELSYQQFGKRVHEDDVYVKTAFDDLVQVIKKQGAEIMSLNRTVGNQEFAAKQDTEAIRLLKEELTTLSLETGGPAPINRLETQSSQERGNGTQAHVETIAERNGMALPSFDMPSLPEMNSSYWENNDGA